MKRMLLPLILALMTLTVHAQSGAGFDRNYKFISSGNITADKNFYLLTVIAKSPDVKTLLAKDETLAAMFDQHHKKLQSTSGNDAVLQELNWSEADSLQVDKAMKALYAAHSATFDRLVNGHLRPSGYYQRFVAMNNAELLARAWGQCFHGMNYIFSQYGWGKKMRYPNIDSASYPVNGPYYQGVLKTIFTVLSEEKMTLFYEPSLQAALRLLNINDRDEPAQFEPLHAGENKSAATAVRKIRWDKYPYSAIVVPGQGPEIYDVPLSPGGKLRCELAAERFKKGFAPFIIVSGGNCHPFHTPFNEAYEMKKFLIKTFAIPEEAIIIEPQARHTTSNFRNATRLMARYGLPMDKPAVCVTNWDQAFYIATKFFEDRCKKELGYVPYKDIKRLGTHELVFYPVLECLHMDPGDPLDP